MTPTGRASLALALGGALWGLYWIPLRWLAGAGVAGMWPLLIMIAGATGVALAYTRPRGGLTRPVLVAGLIMGVAFGLYSAALLLTEVARAILLFYLTPIWGTLLGRLWLAEPLTAARMAALLSAVAGLGVIFGVGTDAFLLANLGDVMALLSGVLWAVGSLLFYQRTVATPAAQSTAFLLGALLTSIFFLPFVEPAPAPSLGTLALTLPAALFVLPMVLLTVWPTSILTPARVGLILMTEVVVGLASAAFFAAEPFGAREATGAALIVLAALIEVFGHREKVNIR